MLAELKPFGEKVTNSSKNISSNNSFNKNFQRSILKLTALYVVIIAGILFISSSVLYSIFSNKLERRFKSPKTITIEITEQNIGRNIIPSPDDVRKDLIDLLLLVNGFLLVTAGALSYKLAEHTLDPIKKAYERERRFLADASHELRTPLSILKLEFENELLNSKKSHGSVQKIKSNLEEVNRMSSIVSDLLTISRLSESEIEINKKNENIDLIQLIASNIGRLNPLASQHKVSLVFNNQTSLSDHSSLSGQSGQTSIGQIFSNKELVEKIILNCLKNSIIYNKENGRAEITLEENTDNNESGSDNNGWVIVKINDTGIGMSSSDQNKIFDRFYRVDTSRSRQTGGSGLGLSIVKSAIEKIGGKIEIKSEIEKGTNLTLYFPKKYL